MAVLTTQQRQDVTTAIQRDKDALWFDIAGTKSDLLTLLGALDDYLEANAAAINSAIPAGVRSQFTTGQKARALAYVALKRYTG